MSPGNSGALLFLLVIIGSLVSLLSCSNDYTKPPLPASGVLDLRNWDFKKDGTIKTIGYWEFYFSDLLTSHQFDTLQEKKFTWVPGVWKGENLGATGYASYRLTILFPPEQRTLAFRINDMGTAYRCFINDSLIAASGNVGTSKEASRPQYLNHVVVIEDLNDTTSVTCWVSNFHYRKGGMWKDIVIGDADNVLKTEKNNFYLYVFISGIWFMVSFVLVCFFIYRPRERSVMLLLFWAFSCLIRMITSDERIITDFFPGIGFEFLVKMELISLYVIVLSGTNTVFWLFPHETSGRLKNIFTYAILIPIVFTVFTRAIFYSNFVVPFQILAFFVIGYSNIVIVKAIIKKREGSVIIGIGFAIMSIIFFVQVPYYNQLTNYSISLYIAFAFIFAFLQVLLLASMFSKALTRAENFAGELEKTVEERTRELVEAQDKLITVARQTETEKIRRRISQDIHDDISSGLNKISWMGELLKIKAPKNRPEETSAMLDKITKASRDTVDHLIEIIWSLNPTNDDLENLLVYLRNYVNRFFDETPFKVTINFPEQLQKIDLNPELKRNLFLVMKEALNNAAKYSKAQNITLNFSYKDSAYTFIITDDGIGIEEGVIKGTGNGMINMRKRMENVNGRFDIVTGPGLGTKILLEGMFY